MMVKMRTTMCGPDGVRHAGETFDVSPDIGQRLVDGGFAVEIEQKMVRTAEKAVAANVRKR